MVVGNQLLPLPNFSLKLLSQLVDFLGLSGLLVLKGLGVPLQLRLLGFLHFFHCFRSVNSLFCLLHLFLGSFELFSGLSEIPCELKVRIVDFRSFLQFILQLYVLLIQSLLLNLKFSSELLQFLEFLLQLAFLVPFIFDFSV